MNKRNQPVGYTTTLGGKLDALAVELRAWVSAFAATHDPPVGGSRDAPASGASGALLLVQARQAGQAMRLATLSARQALQAMAKPLIYAGAASRAPSACPGGVCPLGGGSAAAEPRPSAAPAGGAGGLGGLGSALSSGLGAAMKAALGGDFQRALQSLLGSLARSIAGGIGKAVGGGLGGSLISTLVGTGLSLLIGKLFHKRQSVQVENTVKSEVLNFPRLLGLDFATNPASRLFGERSAARGPAFTVEVNYKGGAEDIVTAKVASRLADLNLQHGVT